MSRRAGTDIGLILQYAFILPLLLPTKSMYCYRIRDFPCKLRSLRNMVHPPIGVAIFSTARSFVLHYRGFEVLPEVISLSLLTFNNIYSSISPTHLFIPHITSANMPRQRRGAAPAATPARSAPSRPTAAAPAPTASRPQQQQHQPHSTAAHPSSQSHQPPPQAQQPPPAQQGSSGPGLFGQMASTAA